MEEKVHRQEKRSSHMQSGSEGLRRHSLNGFSMSLTLLSLRVLRLAMRNAEVIMSE